MAPVDVVARDLTITYRGADRPALREVSVEAAAGSVLLVVGPSGSGKSTFGLALAGVVTREWGAALQGTLAIDGLDVRSYPPAVLAATVGLVLQDPGSQLVMERVEDEVAFGLENLGWPAERMRTRVPEVIAQAGLGGLERRRSNRLSGGQQQRLALASSLAPQPRCLVLDEPTANLDPPGAAALFDRLRLLKAARTATIVLIEHHVEDAWPLADLVLALDRDGTVIDVGPPGEVLARSRERMSAAETWLPGDGESEVPFRPVVAGPTAVSVSAQDLWFGYERAAPVLCGVDLTVGAGERLALVGANGSGKSTLGRLLVGLLRPDRGSVRLFGDDSRRPDGDDPWRLPAAVLARRAGYVFQDPESGFLTDRVGDEVMLGLSDEERAGVPALMERLALPLESFAERSPYRLSGGEARRLSLACTLVRASSLLVLDEPTFGQDRRGYEGLLAILAEHVECGVALVAATHDRRFVSDVATRVVTVADGRLDEGSPS